MFLSIFLGNLSKYHIFGKRKPKYRYYVPRIFQFGQFLVYRTQIYIYRELRKWQITARTYFLIWTHSVLYNVV